MFDTILIQNNIRVYIKVVLALLHVHVHSAGGRDVIWVRRASWRTKAVWALLKKGAIAFLPLFQSLIVILLSLLLLLRFYLCFVKTKLYFTPTPWTASNSVKLAWQG